MLKIFKTLPL